MQCELHVWEQPWRLTYTHWQHHFDTVC